MCSARVAVVLAVGFVCLGSLASAAPVAQVWRSQWGTPRSLSVDPRDGSCWVAAGSRALHLGADGSLLSQTENLSSACSVSVDPRDGSCWAADWVLRCVVRLAPDGTQMWRGGSFAEGSPRSVAVSPLDGSCWVADTLGNVVVHLSAQGEQLWRGGDLGDPSAVAAAADGSCWVIDYYRNAVVHLAVDGRELSRTGGFAGHAIEGLSVNPADGSVWVAAEDQVVHLAEDGTEIWRGGTFLWAACVSAVPSDGSCWVADAGRWDAPMGEWAGSGVVHLAADGSELWRGGDVESVSLVASGPDGSCWAADSTTHEIVHLSPCGLELARTGGGMDYPGAVGVATDGTCWVGYGYGRNGTLALLAPDCTPVWQGGLFWCPLSISVNPRDGSVWVADAGDQSPNPVVLGRVVHLASDGRMLWQGGNVRCPQSVSVSPTDWSCWVADNGAEFALHLDYAGNDLWRGSISAEAVSVDAADGSCWVAANREVLHLASDGRELWRGEGFDNAQWVAVDPRDGSCLMPAPEPGQLMRVSRDGEELWRTGPAGWGHPVGVDPASGVCWLASAPWGSIMAIGPDGTEVWRQAGFADPCSFSVAAFDGSCWIADPENGEVLHVLVTPRLLADVAYDSWANDSIYACVNAGIVWGYAGYVYRPAAPLTRDQMAVYIARALAGGDMAVPTAPAVATFPDVPTDHWAFKYVEYCYDQAVAQGYWDGYHPSETANRAQMAIFVARALVAPSGDAAIPDPEPPPTFPDVPAEHWAYKWIEYCHSQGIVQGYWDGYHPDEAVNRAQMAVYVQRAFDLSL